MTRRGYHQWPLFMILLCFPLRKDKECTKLIAVMHVIPVQNTEDFSTSTARVVELVVTLVLGTSAERREGSSPSLRTTLDNAQLNLGRYLASLRKIDKKPVHSQVAE